MASRCTFEAPAGHGLRLRATLVMADSDAALRRLRNDDPMWSSGNVLLRTSDPTDEPPTPWGGIEFETV